MPDPANIEQLIRDTLATETQAIALSDRLFSPAGLFNVLAPTEQERREVVRSPLFKQAQARFRELQQKEASEFSRVVQQAESEALKGDYLLKLERAEAS